jgi:hypothetical protein
VTSWMRMLSRRTALLLIGVCILAAAGAGWGVFTYFHRSAGTSELLIYRLCIAADKGRCPNDLTFVRNEGEDTVTRWAQRQCAGYKARRIIISDGPTKECDCFVADVRCSSE